MNNPLLNQFNNNDNNMINMFNQFKQNPQAMLQNALGGNVDVSNPQAIIQSMIQKNPQLASMLNGVDMNNPQAVEQVCLNLCQAKGIDYGQFKQMFR